MSDQEQIQGTAQTLRPDDVVRVSTEDIASKIQSLGFESEVVRAAEGISGVTIDSREVQQGDLYVALPGAKAHGAQFADAAVRLGASAILTNQDGVNLVGELPEELGLVVCEDLRAVVGPLAAHVYNSQPSDGSAPTLFSVTGTNGKTTTTYMINSIMGALKHTTGLIGTIEIVAGGTPIPSKLTTPESPHVHSLLSLMRERGITSTAMEVSSHALDYRRVDGVLYDVAGFTNLTQDHLDLHGTMENYFESKAQLMTAERTRKAVISIDDSWGEKMAEAAAHNLGEDAAIKLLTNRGAGFTALPENLADHDWAVVDVVREGIGHRFALVRGDGARLETATMLPADFNVSNAALAAVMVAESGVDFDQLKSVLAKPETLTPVVPGRMQLIGLAPTAIVDFAHNPDALERALVAVDPAEEEGKVIVVFGATGERDQLKRPIMGDIAAKHADIVIVTDDDPHDEAPEPIREAVEAGAQEAIANGARAEKVLNIAPRARAIREALAMAGKTDSVLVAGRGHEVAQEVAGVDLELDDRVEVARSLAAAGFDVLEAYQPMVGE